MKRTLTLGAVWTASAAAAVGLGFLAVSLVDASASPGTFSTATSADDSALPSPTSSVAAPSSEGADDTAGPLAPSPLTSVEQATSGGTVYAGCADGQPVLASAPAAGWWVDDSSGADRVEFSTGTQSIEVLVTCGSGSPQFSVEGPRADDRGGSTRTPAAVSTTGPTADDSTVRVGGGHGADDGAGDDSSGRSGGGHGSDG